MLSYAKNSFGLMLSLCPFSSFHPLLFRITLCVSPSHRWIAVRVRSDLFGFHCIQARPWWSQSHEMALRCSHGLSVAVAVGVGSRAGRGNGCPEGITGPGLRRPRVAAKPVARHAPDAVRPAYGPRGLCGPSRLQHLRQVQTAGPGERFKICLSSHSVVRTTERTVRCREMKFSIEFDRRCLLSHRGTLRTGLLIQPDGTTPVPVARAKSKPAGLTV